MAPTPKTPKTRTNTPSKAPKQVKSTEKKGFLDDFGGLWFNIGVAGLAAAVYALNERPEFKALLPPAAPNKPYATFDEFFPFYLSEHSDSTNRGLHFIGTSLATIVSLLYPATLAALFVAGSIGMIVARWLLFLPHGAVEAAIIFGLFLLLSAKWNRSKAPVFLIPALGYAFAWVGHFYFEHNKPASFIYPTYSLAGDFKMISLILRGEVTIF